MVKHFERSFEADLDRIRQKISAMAALGEASLRKCLQALLERNRQLAYMVILGDRRIDELEKELDQLCMEFLVRQQPVAGPLRFAYSTVRINLELERIGDYAESIARQVLKLIGMEVSAPTGRFREIANLAIPMLHDAVQAFVTQNPELARKTMEVEEAVDVLRRKIDAELYQLRQENQIPLEALTPLMTIARRFERVSDQAKNVCQEVLYSSTGEYVRHKSEDIFRVLFLDEHDSCRARIAVAIGKALGQPKLEFSSAGLDPRPLDARTTEFLRSKGLDAPADPPRALKDLPDLDQFHLIVGLADVKKALPPPPRKTVFLEWTVPDPSAVTGSPEETRNAYEKTYSEIRSHIDDLTEAILGDQHA